MLQYKWLSIFILLGSGAAVANQNLSNVYFSSGEKNSSTSKITVNEETIEESIKDFVSSMDELNKTRKDYQDTIKKANDAIREHQEKQKQHQEKYKKRQEELEKQIKEHNEDVEKKEKELTAAQAVQSDAPSESTGIEEIEDIDWGEMLKQLQSKSTQG